MRFVALIPAAGGGTRVGASLPKQYLTIDGRPVLRHAVERLVDGMPLDAVHVLIAPDDAHYETIVGTIPRVSVHRCGADTRARTVANGLAAIAQSVGEDDWIVVHDAARPCVDRGSLARLCDALRDEPVGALLAMPVASTLKRAHDDGRVEATQPRERLWEAQTPQAFRYAMLRDALATPAAANATDEAQAIEALGFKPRLVTGSRLNMKITYADDLALAAAILASTPR